MSATLTDRYITAAIRGVPPSSQDDVRAELSASIADAVDARTDQGESPEDAEREALTELGDPMLLGASFAGRPSQLIGPRYYASWWRLLKLLLMIVPVCILIGVALGQSIAGAGIGEIIGDAIGATVSGTVHLCFWVTLVFAILERTGADAPEWTLDELPDAPDDGNPRVNLVVGLVLLGLFAGALLWDQLPGFIRIDGEGLPALNPDLWPAWMAAAFALIAAEAVLTVVLFMRGRWSVPLAVANTAISVGFASWVLTLLGRGELMNPEVVDLVLEQTGEPDIPGILAIITGFVTVGITVWAIVDGWLKVRRNAPA